MPLDFFNPRSIIVFICILQGVIFAALLLFRFYKHKKKADLWLAALLLLLCSSLITPFIGFANVYDRNQWLTFFPFTIVYATGVFIWFYVLNLTDSTRNFSKKDLLLFIPAAIYLIFRFTLFAQNLDFKIWFSENYSTPFITPFIFITELIWNISLLYFSIKHYKKYRAWLDENYSDTEKIKFDWLRNFLYIYTFVLVLGAIFDFTGSFITPLSYVQYFYFQFVLALMTYYLAIAGYLRSQTIELDFSEKKEIENKKTLLTENELENLKTKLQNLMETEKSFLDSQITLTQLSRKIGVNSTILSYVINNGFGKNFNEFINEFRVGEVKKKLQNGGAENSNLLEIAFDCGFNSKATFNRAFKKITGLSPKEYQNKPRS